MARFVQGLVGQSLVSDSELEVLRCYLPTDGRMLEIGTYHGVTAAQIADSRPDAIITCVDPFSEGPKTVTGDKDKWLQNQRKNMKLFVGTADSYAASDEKCKEFDLAFVDGAHDYANCLKDMISVAPMVKPLGIIAVHDYCRLANDTNIYRAVAEFGPKFGWVQIERVWTTTILRRKP